MLSDYQIFDFNYSGDIINIGDKITSKIQSLKSTLPENFNELAVLDIGCDFGFWSFSAACNGAKRVVGLDRGRKVRNVGFVDLIDLNRDIVKQFPEKYSNCEFYEIDIGKQWKTYGRFDLIYMFSLYHHIFNNTGAHEPVWLWLYRQINKKGRIIWENPLTNEDGVVKLNVSKDLHGIYNAERILNEAKKYFEKTYIGPAAYRKTREIYEFKPKKIETPSYKCIVHKGSNGASRAFKYADNRRIKEISNILGIKPVHGSLNLTTEMDFDWDSHFYRAQTHDVVDRKKGLDSQWSLRWTRFYPVVINDRVKGFVLRFENEKYKNNFVEVISEKNIRNELNIHDNDTVNMIIDFSVDKLPQTTNIIPLIKDRGHEPQTAKSINNRGSNKKISKHEKESDNGKALVEFRNIHKGSHILVCGLGSSLNQLENPEDYITIGVNDIGRKFDPDYLLVLDAISNFKEDRKEHIISSRAKYVFSHVNIELKNSKLIIFKLGKRGGTSFKDDNSLDYTCNTPYVSINLAIYMGANKIGVIGVDFTDNHFYKKTGAHLLSRRLDTINKEFEILNIAARKHGVEIVNLSTESRITCFKKVSIKEFSAK